MTLEPLIGPRLQIAPEGRSGSFGLAQNLAVPWLEPRPGSDDASLVTWHSAISGLAGRDAELDQLEGWAGSPPPVSVKLVIGPGGAGKHRLAAELARVLQSRGWAAGFVDLSRARSYRLRKRGTLVIIDAPEERQATVSGALAGLTSLDLRAPLRVLLLTRLDLDHWSPILRDAGAETITDGTHVTIDDLEGEASAGVLQTAQTAFADHLGTSPPPVTPDQVDSWLHGPQENARPLFIVSAAFHSAVHSQAAVTLKTGREVFNALADREIARLQEAARAADCSDESAPLVVLALAALAGGISARKIKGAPGSAVLDDEDVRRLQAASVIPSKGTVEPPAPEMLAAAIVDHVLERSGDAASGLIEGTIRGDRSSALRRLCRLAHDAEALLGLETRAISRAIDGAIRLESTLGGAPDTGPAVGACRSLSDHIDGDRETAGFVDEVSDELDDPGVLARVLGAVRQAVDDRRVLVSVHRQRFEPSLARCLTALAGCVARSGDGAKAVDAMREAVGIYQRLADNDPERFEPGLAMSLDSLSVHLAAAGDRAEALRAAQQATDIYRRFAADDPARYEADLAVSLTTLSKRYSEADCGAQALGARREATAIRRRLAAEGDG
jgi:hypothetical protein